MASVVHQVGLSPALIGCSMFCANCWPKQVPAFIIFGGFSLCHGCVTPLRKEIDRDGSSGPVKARGDEYEKIWGKKPEDE